MGESLIDLAAVGRFVAAVVAGVRDSGPQAAMKPGSQVAQPLSAEPVHNPWCRWCLGPAGQVPSPCGEHETHVFGRL